MNTIKAQLFVLPFAGGAKSAFNDFASCIDENIETIVLEYPGRGSRKREPFCATMDELIEDSRTQIINAIREGIPFSIMGYSMGCELAFDLAQHVLPEKPVLCIFCSRESIELDTKGKNYALLNDDEFLNKILAFGGLDERLLKDKRFLDMAMKPIRADYNLLHDYEHDSSFGKLLMDALVFYSKYDIEACLVKKWSEQSDGKVYFYEMGDNHFFINQCYKNMAEIVSCEIIKRVQEKDDGVC